MKASVRDISPRLLLRVGDANILGCFGSFRLRLCRGGREGDHGIPNRFLDWASSRTDEHHRIDDHLDDDAFAHQVADGRGASS